VLIAFDQPGFVAAFLAGIVSTLITTAAITQKSWLPRVEDWFRKLTTSTPTVDEFAKRVRTSHQGFPSDKRSPHYYVRLAPSDKEAPVYQFFAEPEVSIQRFMGFLIPPLDSGHGIEHGAEPRQNVLRFKEGWDKYLQGIKENVSKGVARRIVFFDKEMLHLLLFETRWIFDAAQIEGSEFKALAHTSLLANSARRLIRYAYNIAKIHDRIKDGIECRYVAKAVVAASEYYDFGFYQIEGVPIVYTPIPFKDEFKSLAKEKIYIGDTARQLRGIKEFEADFTRLWERTKPYCDKQLHKAGTIKRESLTPASSYCQLDFLTVEFFEAIYFARIKEIVQATMGIDVEEDDYLSPNRHGPT